MLTSAGSFFASHERATVVVVVGITPPEQSKNILWCEWRGVRVHCQFGGLDKVGGVNSREEDKKKKEEKINR